MNETNTYLFGDFPSQREYERELKRRQKEHLDSIPIEPSHRPCLHDGCPECHGTGRKQNGTSCVHMISCPCPKCTPYYC